MDDSWENGDDNGGNGNDDRKGGGAGLKGVVNPDDPGWQPTLDAAIKVAWEQHHKAGTGPAVYKADLYVKGENPISGYRVVLSP